MRLWKIETADGSILYVHAPSSGEASDIANSWLKNKDSFDRVSATSLSGPGTVGVPGADVLTRGNAKYSTPISVGKISAVNKLSFYENLASGSSIDFRNDVAREVGWAAPKAPAKSAYDPSEFPEFDWWGQDPLPPADGNGGGERGVPIVGTEDFGDLRPAFERGLGERGIGIGPGSGVRGQLADAAFQNLRSRGFLNLALNAPAGSFDADAFADPNAPTQAEIEAAAGPTFQEFARTRGLFGGAGAADALGLFRKALTASAERLPGFGEVDDVGDRTNRFTSSGMGAMANPITGAFLNPAQGGQAATDLARVAREAGRSRFGFASGFLPTAQQLSTSYFAQPQATAMNFADYLKQRIFG